MKGRLSWVMWGRRGKFGKGSEVVRNCWENKKWKIQNHGINCQLLFLFRKRLVKMSGIKAKCTSEIITCIFWNQNLILLLLQSPMTKVFGKKSSTSWSYLKILKKLSIRLGFDRCQLSKWLQERVRDRSCLCWRFLSIEVFPSEWFLNSLFRMSFWGLLGVLWSYGWSYYRCCLLRMRRGEFNVYFDMCYLYYCCAWGLKIHLQGRKSMLVCCRSFWWSRRVRRMGLNIYSQRILRRNFYWERLTVMMNRFGRRRSNFWRLGRGSWRIISILCLY